MRYLVLLAIALGASSGSALETIAHRGYACGTVENTLESVRKAWAVSVDAVEVDVRVSIDGVAYLYHDDELDSRGVADMTYAQLQEASAFQVPRLSELLAERFTGSGYFLLDLKSVDTAQLQVLAEVIRHSRVPLARVAMHSDSTLALRDIGRRLPGVRLVYLSRLKRQFPFFLAPKPRKLIEEARYAGAQTVSLKGRRFITEKFVHTLQQAGLKVNVWTINSNDSMRFYRDVGVDGLITDAPVQLKRLLDDNPDQADACQEAN